MTVLSGEPFISCLHPSSLFLFVFTVQPKNKQSGKPHTGPSVSSSHHENGLTENVPEGAGGGGDAVSSSVVTGATAAAGNNNNNTGQDHEPTEAKNKKAVAVVLRVRDKLTGRDFDPNITLDANQQVDLLIKQATSHENLCQCYIGWCPFW